MIQKVLVIGALLFITYAFNFAQNKPLKQQDHIINQAINDFVANKDFKNASIGILVSDTKTGEVIAEYNPKMCLMPASTQKLITTATAFEVLGKNYRFFTQLEYSGTIDTINRILKGNIYVRGGGDPTLGSNEFDKGRNYRFIENWINVLKKNKIDSIDGLIIADASKYSYEIASPKWLWEEVGNYYGAGANGLTVFDNMYRIHFQSPVQANELTQVIELDPEIPGLIINNDVLSSDINSDEAYVFGSPYSYLHNIRGTIPKGKDNFMIKGAIPDPAYYLAWFFKEKLAGSGIQINGKATTIRLLLINGDTVNEKRQIMDVVPSPSLNFIINKTNKKSINLFAEHLMVEIGFKLKQQGSITDGAVAISDFWKSKGMDTDGFYIYDGCGLSRSDCITPEQFVFVLTYMKNKSKNFEEFYESLPIAGKSGTLSSTGKGTSAEGAIHAKSGSIDRVRAYTGYATSKSGRELAFAINVSNYNCNDYTARVKLTDLMIAMADFNL